MKNIIFFGDSFTEALNNNFDGFVSKMNLYEKGYNVMNYGVSGTTLAPYSLYPVGNNDLLSLISVHEKEIKKANIIFLEYGINDFASVAIGYIRNLDVQIAFSKCLDYIKQLNPQCNVIYLIPSFNIDVINIISKSQKKYLTDDYLSLWKPQYNHSKFVKEFNDFITHITSVVTVFEMIFDTNFMKYNIDEKDHIHPNNEGYQIIAENILEQLKIINYE